MAGYRGATAIVGSGQTPFYKRGTSPDAEVKLCLRAIVAACEDAGVDPADVDGFVSFGSDHNDGQRLMLGLGTKELRFGALSWTHGGGSAGAIGLASAAIVSGQAEVVVVYRAMAENRSGRLRVAVAMDDLAAQYMVNGVAAPITRCGLITNRMLEARGVPRSTMTAMVRAAYYHARNNPNAYGRDADFDEDIYERSRMIAEPNRVYDCSRENDHASALLMVSAERARDLVDRPAYVLSAPTGTDLAWGGRNELNDRSDSFAGFAAVSRRLWAESGYRPGDVDVAQVYENTSGLGVGAMLDLGFCAPEAAGDFFRFENLIAPSGGLPVNTSGGNLAEGFIHGLSLVNEAVRQIRGDSPNQLPGASLSLVTGGPGDAVASAALLGTEETL